MAEQQLDRFQLAAAGVAQLGARPAQVMPVMVSDWRELGSMPRPRARVSTNLNTWHRR